MKKKHEKGKKEMAEEHEDEGQGKPKMMGMLPSMMEGCDKGLAEHMKRKGH